MGIKSVNTTRDWLYGRYCSPSPGVSFGAMLYIQGMAWASPSHRFTNGLFEIDDSLNKLALTQI